MQAKNEIGYGPASVALVAVAADPPSQPNTPQIVTEQTGASQIGVTWQAPLENGGSPITHYVLYWKE